MSKVRVRVVLRCIVEVPLDGVWGGASTHDELVTVGTREGLAKLNRLLQGQAVVAKATMVRTVVDGETPE